MTHVLRTLAVAAALLAAGLPAAPPASAIDSDWPSNVQNKPSNPELWQRIKEGEKGTTSSGADQVLIKPLPGCSDRAVGFTTPVNVNIPVVGTPQGKGPSFGALAVLAALFGFFCGAGVMVARNLGKHPSAVADPPALPRT